LVGYDDGDRNVQVEKKKEIFEISTKRDIINQNLSQSTRMTQNTMILHGYDSVAAKNVREMSI